MEDNKVLSQLQQENDCLRKKTRLPDNTKKHNCLVIFEKGIKGSLKTETYEYYAIRRQEESLREAINRFLEKYPGSNEVYKLTKDVNGIKSFNLVKQELLGIIKWNGNHFESSLPPYKLRKKLVELFGNGSGEWQKQTKINDYMPVVKGEKNFK